MKSIGHAEGKFGSVMRDINCRARISVDCENGEKPYYDQKEDGTWNGKSVVCDPCYAELMPFTPSGRALLDEIDEALEKIREIQA